MNHEPTSFFLFRSLSSFVPSCTRSSLMSSSMRWWNRWFQHLSIVLPKSTVQRRPSLASWCSTKFTIRSICTKGWWSRWFHWHLWSLSHDSDQAFIPKPCYLKPVWSPILFSYGCFVRHELPHQQTSFINLSEWSMGKGAQRLWMHFCGLSWCRPSACQVSRTLSGTQYFAVQVTSSWHL